MNAYIIAFLKQLTHARQPPYHYPSAFCRVGLGRKCTQAGTEQDRSGLVEITVPFDMRKFSEIQTGIFGRMGRTYCLMKIANASKFVKNAKLRVVFSILFLVFQYVVIHGLSCLIHYFKAMQNYGRLTDRRICIRKSYVQNPT